MKKLFRFFFKKRQKAHFETLVSPRQVTEQFSKYSFILIALLTLLTSSSFSQAYMNFGAGITSPVTYTVKSTHSVSPVMKISAGYQFQNNIVAEAIIQPSITRKVDANNYFGAKAGYNYRGFNPSISALYNYRSADDVSMNGWQVGYALKYQYPLNEHGGLYAEALYTQSSYSITAGFNIQF